MFLAEVDEYRSLGTALLGFDRPQSLDRAFAHVGYLVDFHRFEQFRGFLGSQRVAVDAVAAPATG